jgi:hypothetical protein
MPSVDCLSHHRFFPLLAGCCFAGLFRRAHSSMVLLLGRCAASCPPSRLAAPPSSLHRCRVSGASRRPRILALDVQALSSHVGPFSHWWCRGAASRCSRGRDRGHHRRTPAAIRVAWPSLGFSPDPQPNPHPRLHPSTLLLSPVTHSLLVRRPVSTPLSTVCSSSVDLEP